MIMKDIKEQIWEELAHTRRWSGFFITAEIHRAGEELPVSLQTFIDEKYRRITQEGISARRFVFQEREWRIYLTFFPTSQVVDERYALKNKVMFR